MFTGESLFWLRTTNRYVKYFHEENHYHRYLHQECNNLQGTKVRASIINLSGRAAGGPHDNTIQYRTDP